MFYMQVLCNIQVFAKAMPSLFSPYHEDFFISSSDSYRTKTLKLEILSTIATISSIPSIFLEFQVLSFAICLFIYLGNLDLYALLPKLNATFTWPRSREMGFEICWFEWEMCTDLKYLRLFVEKGSDGFLEEVLHWCLLWVLFCFS